MEVKRLEKWVIGAIEIEVEVENEDRVWRY